MPGDRDLIQIVDAAMGEAVRKSGFWLACRPGCFACCLGPFPITALDAARLRQGLAVLEAADPARATRVRSRAQASVAQISRDFPIDALGCVLASEEACEDEPCPALDPQTGTCDLYEARPIICRTFGPAVRFGANAVAVCELCYRGASQDEIARCQVEVDPQDLESELLRELENSTSGPAETTVAFALAAP